MKKTELNFFEDNALAGYDYYPFYDVYKTIQELTKIRKTKNNFSRGLNYTIIIQITTFIEGMSTQILESSIEPKLYDIEVNNNIVDKKFYLRILESLENKINNSFFNALPENWKLIHGLNLKSEIEKKDKNLWRSIDTLFSLRNAISHGHKLTIEYHPTDKGNTFDIKVLDKYKNVYDFLTEKKLIKSDSIGMVQLVNDEVTDFFAIEAKKFINALLQIIPEKRECAYARNRFFYIKEQTL